MDKEDIIRMAREAQLVYGSDEKPLNSVIRFASLVAEHEREACVQIADDFDQEMNTSNYGRIIANRIRARGEK